MESTYVKSGGRVYEKCHLDASLQVSPHPYHERIG
jgi:hypothetical protein